MATYLQGISDYIPSVQSFVPDYNFLSNVLQTKQSRYDQSRKQVSNFYGTLLNSPMSRQDNIQKREEFFKNVDGEIEKLSGIDLSLQQNQDYAMQIFKPFYEDKGIIKDMRWTKNTNLELDRAEGFRTGCIDPEKCGGEYWDGGVDYIKYKTQEFQQASPTDALGFEDVTFNPQINVFTKAQKLIKDSGFEVKVDSIAGGYMVTDKNGKNMIAPLTSYLQTAFGNDPAVQKYYETMAYLNRKSYVASQAPIMGEENALAQYQVELFKKAEQNLAQADSKNQKSVDKTTALRKSIEDYIKKKGVLPNQKEVIDAYVSIVEQNEVSKQAKQVSQGGVNLINNTKLNAQNNRLLGERLDQLVGQTMLNNHLAGAAEQYATLTAEHTIKGADPYSLSAYNKDLDFQYDLMKIPYEIDKAVAIETGKLRAKDQYDKQKSNQALGQPAWVPNPLGSATEMKSSTAQKDNQLATTDVKSHTDGAMMEGLQESIKTMSATFQKSTDPNQQATLKETIQDVLKLSTYTPAEQLEILSGKKTFDPSRVKSSPELRYAYGQIEDLLASNSVNGIANKFWTDDYQTTGKLLQSNVEVQKYKEQAFTQLRKKQTEDIQNRLVANWGDDPVKGLLLKSMIESVDGLYVPELSGESLATQARLFSKKYGNKIQPRDGKTGEQLAYEYAMKNAGEVDKEWDSYYAQHASSYKDIFQDKKSNAKVGAGYTMNVDAHPDYVSNPNNMLLTELEADYQANLSGAIVDYGNSGKIPEDNPQARRLLETYFQDLQNQDKTGARAKGNIIIQSVAGGDDNYMAFKLTTSEKWAAGYKGKEKDPGLTADGRYREGIMVYLPKNNIGNSFYENTKVDAMDEVLNELGKIEINKIPSGQLSITKTGQTYSIDGELYAFNPKTKQDEKIKVNKQIMSGPLDASTLYDTWTRNLLELQQYNEAAKGNIQLQEGIRDPNQIIQELLNPNG